MFSIIGEMLSIFYFDNENFVEQKTKCGKRRKNIAKDENKKACVCSPNILFSLYMLVKPPFLYVMRYRQASFSSFKSLDKHNLYCRSSMPDVYPKCFAEIIILSRMHQSYHVDPVRYHQKKTNCVGKTIL